MRRKAESAPPSGGFTLVELLVVIAIIGILVALLFPAVQSAREAGRRITCANHLKQFALAVSDYAAAHEEELPAVATNFFGTSGRRALPSGWKDCNAWGERQSHSYRVALLPFLEEQNLYDQFDFSVGVVTTANVPAISHVLPIFQCPSTPGFPRSILQSKNDVHPRAIPDGVRVGAWDYGVPRRQGQSLVNGGFITPAWNGARNRMMFAKKELGDPCPLEKEYGPAKLKWVTDGLSKTTVAHEIAYRPNYYRAAGLDGIRSVPVVVGSQAVSEGEIMSGITWPFRYGTGWAQFYRETVMAGRRINSINFSNGRFAFHPGGVNNAFLDGSVRFLDEATDLGILEKMDSRDGESIRR